MGAGVPKLNRTELETACEDFSNIIDTQDGCILYKGTLSSGVEIAVISTTILSIKDWSKRAEKAFQKKVFILTLFQNKFLFGMSYYIYIIWNVILYIYIKSPFSKSMDQNSRDANNYC